MFVGMHNFLNPFFKILISCLLLLQKKDSKTVHPFSPFYFDWALGHIGQSGLKSDNLQYNTLGLWDERLIDQASDVPSIIIFS